MRVAERLVEVVVEVVGVLDAGRKTKQIARAWRVRPLHGGAMLEQTLHASERGRAFPELNPRRRGDGTSLAACDANGEHASKSVPHLPRCDLMTEKFLQPRIEHMGNMRMRVEAIGKPRRVRRCCAHARKER